MCEMEYRFMIIQLLTDTTFLSSNSVFEYWRWGVTAVCSTFCREGLHCYTHNRYLSDQ